MKKYILITLALASVAAGCTKSNFVDVPEAQTTPITFETYTGKTPVTKATEKTTLSLAQSTASAPAFHVKAFYNSSLYMNEDVWSTCKFTDNDNTTISEQGWDYDGTVYWPSAGNVTFYAYGISSNLRPNSNADDETAFTYTVPPTVSTQDDLIVAIPVTQDGSENNSAVSLNFKHLLSKVGFTLMTTDQNDIEINVKRVVMTGKFHTSGTVSLENAEPKINVSDEEVNTVTSYSLLGTAYDSSTPGTYSIFKTSNVPTTGAVIYPNYTHQVTASSDVAPGPDSIITDADKNNRFMMIIPGALPTKVDIVYQLTGASDQHVEIDFDSVQLNFDKFEPGKAYEFIIKVSTDKIDFTGEVLGWDETDINQPIPKTE